MNKTVHIFSRVDGILLHLKKKTLPTSFIKIPFPGSNGTLTNQQLESLQKAEILIAEPGLITQYNLVQNLPNLKWMQLTWAGIDAIMKSLDPSKPLPKYKLSRFGGYFGNHMAEYVVGHIISYERNFAGMKYSQQQCKWDNDKFYGYRILQELQIGILGAGDIGREVAQACKNMKMTVWGMVSQSLPQEQRQSYIDHYRTSKELPEILQNCDYICNILPSTPATRQMLSGQVLSQCTKKPVFINVGRGDVINEESIVKALDNEWISHAILDVFETEPLPEGSPLWKHPKVTITPHVSACTLDFQVADMFEENFKRYTENKELKFTVSWEKGY